MLVKNGGPFLVKTDRLILTSAEGISGRSRGPPPEKASFHGFGGGQELIHLRRLR